MTREEAIDVLKCNYPSACFESLCEAVEIAIQALSAQPERKKGKWIIIDSDEEKYEDIKCPNCKMNFTVDACRWCDIGFTVDDLKFCPNCGAEMEGDEDDK